VFATRFLAIKSQQNFEIFQPCRFKEFFFADQAFGQIELGLQQGRSVKQPQDSASTKRITFFWKKK
jgi:hypothetical protein